LLCKMLTSLSSSLAHSATAPDPGDLSHRF
jgi:hypothetical protein